MSAEAVIMHRGFEDALIPLVFVTIQTNGPESMALQQIFLRQLIRSFRRPVLRSLLLLLGVLTLMLLLFATTFYLFEKDVTFGDGLWTAYITLTTIGYGDFSARTVEGRFITVFTSMIGIACFGLFTGVILEKAIQRRTRKMKGEGQYTGRDHLVIVNLSSYDEIRDILKELDLSPDFKDLPRVLVSAVLPNDDKEIPDSLANQIDGYISGMPSRMETLERANLQFARGCLLLSSPSNPSMDDTNTLTAGLIEKKWPHVITVMACGRSETLNNLAMFNIDGGVSAMNLQMGLLVQELEDPGVFEVYSQLSSNTGGNQIYISRTPVGQWTDSATLRFGQVKLAAMQLDFAVEILGIKRKSQETLMLNPGNGLPLENEDRVVYLATKRFPWQEESSRLIEQINKNLLPA